MTPFEQGGSAYFAGKSLDDNPYDFDSAEAHEWEDGWLYMKGGRHCPTCEE